MARSTRFGSLDLDLDGQINTLENEWRMAYEASIAARAEYQELSARRSASVELVDLARERLERAEANKARIMTRIERLGERVLGQG
jgi:hypothetical protein